MDKIAEVRNDLDIDSMVESYRRRLFIYSKNLTNSQLLSICLLSYRHGIQDALEEKELSNLANIGKKYKEDPKFKVGSIVKNIKSGNEVVINSITDGLYLCDIYNEDGDYSDDYCFYVSEQEQWELVEETAPHRPKVTDREATGKLKECIDNITDESLAKARKQLQEELVSEDLEKAIDTYLATYFGGEKEKQEWPFLKKMAIHFAEWQKKKDDYAIEIAHMAGEEEGKNIMKQQLMAKAVDVTIAIPYQNGYGGFTQLVDSKEGLPFGDNIKVLVIKEDRV